MPSERSGCSPASGERLWRRTLQHGRTLRMWVFSHITGLVSLLNCADLEQGRDPGCRCAGRGLVPSPKTRYVNPSSSPLFFPSVPLPVCIIPELSSVAEVKGKRGFVPFPALGPLAVASLHRSVSHGWSSPGAHMPWSMTSSFCPDHAASSVSVRPELGSRDV